MEAVDFKDHELYTQQSELTDISVSINDEFRPSRKKVPSPSLDNYFIKLSKPKSLLTNSAFK